MQSKRDGIFKRLCLNIRKTPVFGFIIWWIYMLFMAPKKVFILSAEQDRLERSNQELNILIKELNDRLKEIESGVTDIITKELIESGKSKIKDPNLKPVFIHSIFRSGSTYLWNKFRGSGNFWSYHEPFHETMLNLEIKDQKEMFGNPLEEHIRLLGHPPTDKNYFWEYFTINKKVPAFRKGFTFDYFYIDENEDREDIENYIYFLIGHAPKRSVFKFTRSSLRSRWLKKHFDSVNIYLLRNPRFQFESYQSRFKKGDLYFHTMSLMTIGKNQHRYSLFSELSKKCDIPYYNSENFNDERLFYSKEVLSKLNTKDLYTLFYSLWLSSLIENFNTSDILFYIDAVSSSRTEKQRIMKEFKKFNIDLDLSDCSIKQYQDLSLSNEEFRESEDTIYNLIEKLNLYDKNYLINVVKHIKMKI